MRCEESVDEVVRMSSVLHSKHSSLQFRGNLNMAGIWWVFVELSLVELLFNVIFYINYCTILFLSDRIYIN